MGSQCSNGRYIGRTSITQSGLRCVPWQRLNRTLHTVTPDRSKTFENFVMYKRIFVIGGSHTSSIGILCKEQDQLKVQSEDKQPLTDQYVLIHCSSICSVLFDRYSAGTQTKTWLALIVGTQTHLSKHGATQALYQRPLTFARCQPVTPLPHQRLHPQQVHHHQGQTGHVTRR